jgi:DNA-binding Lrp family transcriptional regulator
MLKGEDHQGAAEKLDTMDLRIMKVLLANNGIPPGSPAMRKSFRSMAKDLRVDQGTIRSRMKKFQEQRILKGWYLGVSPALMGHSVVHAWLDVEPERDKEGLIHELVLVRGVERVCNYLGPRVSLILLYRKEKDLELSLKRITKLARSNKLFHGQGAPPVPYPNLTETDAAIIGSLQQDPWKPYLAAAKELGFSVKTVKRRVTRLSETGAIYMLPDVNLKALQGIIPVELVVFYGSGELKAEVNERIASRIRDELVFSQISGLHGYFALMVPNVSMVEGIERWVKQQNGVSDVHTEVLLDVVLNPNHYKSQYVAVGREAGREPSPKAPTIAT